jgi:hypothetical protein
MAFLVQILKALWAMHPQRFWLIWFTITTASLIYAMSMVGQVATPTSQKTRRLSINVILTRRQPWNPRAIMALTLLTIFLASYIALILVWEDFAYYDNDLFMLYALKGHNFPPPIWRDNGRFFPFGLLEFNLIRHFTNTPIGYHVVPIIQVILFVCILLILDDDLSVTARTALAIVILLTPSVFLTFGGLIYEERSVLFFFSILLLSVKQFEGTKAVSWAVAAMSRVSQNGDDVFGGNASFTTTSAYESALSAGCPSGSVCDPSTWPGLPGIVTYFRAFRNLGQKVMIDFNGPPSWNSNNGSDTGVPLDDRVYEDEVRKITQAFTPEYAEPDPEPETNGLSTSQYATIYFDVCTAIRSVSSTVQIGGSGSYTGGGPSYVAAIFQGGTIPANCLNYVSIHHYSSASGLDSQDLQTLSVAPAGTPRFVTEWNYDGNACNTEDNNAADTVSWIGDFLISLISNGITGSTHYAATDPSSTYYPGGPPNCAASVWSPNGSSTNGILVDKAYAWYLLSKQLGLGAGASSVKSTSVNGVVAAAVGALNSAGNPVVAFVNYNGGGQTATVTMNNLPLSGTVTANVYLADYGSNHAQSPIETLSLPITNGSVTLSVPMSAYSVAGIILR